MTDETAQNTNAENRAALVPGFTTSNPDYYTQQFQKIGSRSRFTWTFNWVAALLGPIWYGLHGLRNWA